MGCIVSLRCKNMAALAMKPIQFQICLLTVVFIYLAVVDLVRRRFTVFVMLLLHFSDDRIWA